MIKPASIFSLACGACMLAVWGILLAAGQVAELMTSPFQAGFLLVAEILTAISLISGGFGLLAGKNWGLRLELAALGMLLYCAVFSVGVFGQAGNAPAAIFFAVIFTVSVVFSMNFILGPVKGGSK